MKYREMISDGLCRQGWSVGWFKFISTVDRRERWSADASKNEGKRIVVQAEELGAAFFELEMRCRAEGRAVHLGVGRN